MNVVPFIADSPSDALAQIRGKLGPDAVVLNVRRLPANGVSRLWSKGKIEVLACATETPAQESRAATALLDVRDSSEPLILLETTAHAAGSNSAPESATSPWRTAKLLETMGISAVHAERVLETLKRTHGERAPDALSDELTLAREVLNGFWNKSHSAQPPQRANGTHIFIGPPGTGKTTALCKWVTQATLMESTSARVWRLDVPRANTAESLSVHCEILNVPVERSWNPGVTWAEQLLFIDLPGFESSDDPAFAQTEKFLATVPGASVTLVLNAAYDVALLQNQVRAFSRLPITHLLFTHLDEERRWSKLWNFVLGTNYSLSFLSAGQNIPGRFLPAAPELLFPGIFRRS
jgi:flagellar biosynthesis protein FlhF